MKSNKESVSKSNNRWKRRDEIINLIHEGAASGESSSLSGHIHTGMNATQDLISRRFVTKDIYILMHSVVVALYFILQNELQELPTVNKVTMNSIFEMHPVHAPIRSRYCQSAQDTICVVVAIDYFL